jgi:hypothetical protein
MKRILAGLIVVHRYLGAAFCLVFLIWFASGIVMIFKRMPEYSPQERLARLPPLDPGAVRLTPVDAFEAAGLGGNPERVILTSLNGRPVYRFIVGLGSLTVSAEDGSYVDSVDPDAAVTIAGGLFPEHQGTATFLDSKAAPDQWTIGNRFNSTGALHRVSLGDAAGTELYIAEATGEIVQKTDRSTRFWGYAGPVTHWFYFTPLRAARAPLWNDLIVYGSVVGCILCILGLIIGVYRFSISRRFLRGTSLSPYVGWLRWHHYAGLLFGVITLTWTFSGLLTMTPWNLFPQGPAGVRIDAIRGEGVRLDRFVLPPAAALGEFGRALRPKEIEFVQFMGTPFYAASDGRATKRLVSAGIGPPGTRSSFTRDELVTAATAAMGGHPPVDVAWLAEYDSYYYDRTGDRPLPVLRAKFDDPDQTWLYLNAADGSIVGGEVRGSRAERWLYQALHSLDFPGLYQIPWLWYPLIVGLSLGGLALSATSVVIAWRFLTGTARRGRPQEAPLL